MSYNIVKEYRENEVQIRLCFYEDDIHMYRQLYAYKHDLESMLEASLAWNEDDTHAEISYTMTGLQFPDDQVKAEQFSDLWEKKFKDLVEEPEVKS